VSSGTTTSAALESSDTVGGGTNPSAENSARFVAADVMAARSSSVSSSPSRLNTRSALVESALGSFAWRAATFADSAESGRPTPGLVSPFAPDPNPNRIADAATASTGMIQLVRFAVMKCEILRML